MLNTGIMHHAHTEYIYACCRVAHGVQTALGCVRVNRNRARANVTTHYKVHMIWFVVDTSRTLSVFNKLAAHSIQAGADTHTTNKQKRTYFGSHKSFHSRAIHMVLLLFLYGIFQK